MTRKSVINLFFLILLGFAAGEVMEFVMELSPYLGILLLCGMAVLLFAVWLLSDRDKPK